MRQGTASLLFEQYGKRVKVAFAGVTETDEVIPAPPRAEERVPFPMDTDVPPEKGDTLCRAVQYVVSC